MIRNESFPDIYMDGMKDNNPYICSPNVPYAIFFYQTRDTLFGDADIFKRFIDNCIMNFRQSRFYKQYKSYLYDIGLDHCQVLSHIDGTMAKLEMHHNGLTIFDIAMIIIGHLLNTKGKVCTFDVTKEMKKCHKDNIIPLVMLSISIHQMVHNDDQFFIPTQMCFGFWPEFLFRYNRGITYGVAKKINYWIKISLEHSYNQELNTNLLALRDNVQKWSEYNEYCNNNCSSNRSSNSIINRIY